MVHLYSADRAEPLAKRLAEVLIDDPGDPMEPLWLAVPTAGMRRWLNLELARYLGASDPGAGDGVAANFLPVLPGALLDALLAAGAHNDDPDPWQVDRLVWPLLDVAEARAGDPSLAQFLRLPNGGSRFSRARRVADLFDRYHQRRPEMILSWHDGRAPLDGSGEPLDRATAWQARLWTEVRGRIGRPSPPERVGPLLAQLRAGGLGLDLPGRLVFFGFTALPGTAFPELVRAVGESRVGDRSREVHVFLLRTAAFAIEPMLAQLPTSAQGGTWLRSGDPTEQFVRQPLLRSWGRSAREGALLLADATRHGLPVPEQVADPTPAPSTLLGRLQAALRTDGEIRQEAPEPRDRSIELHACFGPMRQVQAARDVLLHLLADDRSLAEEDILVLCPKLERFAPLVESVFGGITGGDESASTAGAPTLRFRIADQSIRSVNPVLGATSDLLELVSGRFDAPGVLDLLASEPVRRQYGFDDDDIRTISTWVGSTNVRWGIDGHHREEFGVSAEVTGFTWEAALDRLLVGVTVGDGSVDLALGGVAPFGVDGGDVETLGQLAEAVGVIVDLARRSRGTAVASQWIALVRAACDALFATPPDLRWQLDALHRSLDGALDQSVIEGRPSEVPLTYLDVRRLIERSLDDAPGRPDFFRGGVTVSSMAPLRWVPYRVVCLLGMDQDAFGVTPAPAEDLIAAAPRFGDPDPRSDDRQRLLEAVLAAGERLVVVRDGRDVRTNQEVKRSVVVAELVESVCSLVPTAERDALQKRVEVRHPRHGFDRACLVPGELVSGGPWSFDPRDKDAAVARAGRSTVSAPLVAAPLPVPTPEVIELDELRSFLRKPVPYFVRRVLGVQQPEPMESSSSELPVSLDNLEQWKVATRLLDARLQGVPVDRWRTVESASSTLPPGVLGDAALAKVTLDVEAIRVRLDELGVRSTPSGQVRIDVRIADGTRIVGTVPLRLDPPTPGPARVTYSTAKPAHRLDAWLDLLVLVASDPSVDWRSLVVARKSGKTKVRTVEFDLVAAGTSEERRPAVLDALEVVVDCFRRGRREPLPLFPTLSYHLHLGTERPDQWRGGWGSPDGEDIDVRLAFGDLGFRELLAIPARADDVAGEGKRALRYARYLWTAYDRTVVDHPTPTPSSAAPARRRKATR